MKYFEVKNIPSMSSTTEEGKASFAIGTAEREQGLRPGKVVALGEEALGDLDAVPAAPSRQEAPIPPMPRSLHRHPRATSPR